ncbi:MAG: class I SAM-dependent methyltransferase [Lachnospiraceae bacterium]|nr:class I SAM-dependent methyltransferase [Lachnospiraceae bacterium]
MADNNTDVNRQLKVLKRILSATDEQMHDNAFLIENIKEYGITPLAWLQELDNTTTYTENGMIQVPGEFAQFIKCLVDIEVESAIEVGVYRGRSSYFICAVLYRNNPRLRYDMVDIADSLDEYERFREILPCLNKCIPNTSDDLIGKEYDFVFIDADHGYEGAMRDYLNVGRYAKKLVCFHDIYAHEYDSCDGGIVRCWEEVCVLTEHLPKMVFSQFPDRWMGIGVVLNDDNHKAIGADNDYEDIQDKSKQFMKDIEGLDTVYVYGARNDSRRMYDALERIGIDNISLVINDDSENPENVTKYPIAKLENIEEDATVVVCYRDSLVETAMIPLRQYDKINVIIADEKIASFI